jgi:hypothetical protein
MAFPHLEKGFVRGHGGEHENSLQAPFDGLLPMTSSISCKAAGGVSGAPYASLNTLIAFLSSAVLNTEVAVFPELVVA